MKVDDLQQIYLDLLDPAVQIKVTSVAETGTLTFESEAARDAFYARAAEEVPQILRPIRTEAEYGALVAGLDKLLDIASDSEGSPLWQLISDIGDLVEAYDEDTNLLPSASECIRSSAAALRKAGLDVEELLAEAEAAELLIPNRTTEAAMREARAGDLPRFASVEDLIAELKERGHRHDR